MTFDPSDLGWLVPYLILAVAGMVLVLAEAFYKGKDHTGLAGLTVAGSLASAIAVDHLVPPARRRRITPGVRRHARRRPDGLCADRAVRGARPRRPR